MKETKTPSPKNAPKAAAPKAGGSKSGEPKAPAAKTGTSAKSDARNFRKLSNVEHVRMRTGMWLGQNSSARIDQHFFPKSNSGTYTIEHEEIEVIPAVWKCLDEACMNSIDEYQKNLGDKRLKPKDRMNRLDVALSNDLRTVTVTDNGRGIPLDNVEGVYLHLMYGENFDDMAQSDHVAGQNGVGVSLVRMVSEYFKVISKNNGSEYTRLFTVADDFDPFLKGMGLSEEKREQIKLYFDEHGNLDECVVLNDAQKLKCAKLMEKNFMKERIRKCSEAAHGVSVEFRLSSKYFNNLPVSYNLKLFRQYVQDIAMTNPGLKVNLTHKNKAETFLFKRGLEEIFLNSDHVYYKMTHSDPKSSSQINMNAFIVVGQNKNLSWVNSNFASLGGSPFEYLENRICDEVRKRPAISSLEKKLKTSATRNDVRSCFHMYIDLRVLHPRFKSQDKSYLINDLNEEMRSAVEKHLDKLLKKTDLINEVKLQMERRVNLKVLEDAEKGLRRATRENIPKLIPATGDITDPARLLFIAEGDSAVAGLRPARNPKIHGLFPLKGKPLNVKGIPLAKAMANEEVKNIVAILGLPLQGKVKDTSDLKYRGISIITDADFDGYAIRSLMLSFFYEYWPELFDLGFIYITTAPLYEVEIKKGKETEIVFCVDDSEFEKLRKSSEKNGTEIIRKKRNKGLGESSIAAMKFAVEKCLVQIGIDTPKKSSQIQNLWFNKKMAEARREAISMYTGSIYDEN